MPGRNVLPQYSIDIEMQGGDDPSLHAAWRKFASLLKDSHCRVTTARHIVFVRACELAGHFSADDLVAQLAHGRSRVSRATVYRTLELMLAAAIVAEVRDANGHVLYEHIFDRPMHEHMICDRCGRFIECVELGIEARIDDVCKANGFSKRGHRLIVFGTCNKCGR